MASCLLRALRKLSRENLVEQHQSEPVRWELPLRVAHAASLQLENQQLREALEACLL